MAVDRVRCRELTNADDDNDIAARIEQGFIQACFFWGGGISSTQTWNFPQEFWQRR